MLRKVFKTILVLCLCAGLAIPTNAAVSVSDGSAFVTKAEFAADLNNLSNRMAQLENSLDAKIDSLVSSYLTRNGIWNGAKQTVESIPSVSVGFLFRKDDNLMPWVFAQEINVPPAGSPVGPREYNNRNLYLYDNAYRAQPTTAYDFTFVLEADKTGLCNTIVRFTNLSFQLPAFNTFLAGTIDSVHGDFWGTSLNLNYAIYANAALMYDSNWSLTMPSQSGYSITFPAVINCYYFINKQDRLRLVLTPTVRNSSRPIVTYGQTDLCPRVTSIDAYVY